MRLDKFVSQSLAITRKQTKQVLHQQLIKVDDVVVSRADRHIKLGVRVTYAGRVLPMPGPLYFMLNKPDGYICATKDSRHPTVLDLIDEPRVFTLHPVGRLDIDTTGLVLLTDDGKWSHGITSPKRQKIKRYLVRLAEPLASGVEQQFEAGIMLDGEKKPTLPAQLKRISATEVEICIQEGRYHQVKRMFAAVGNAVTVLHRQAIGPVSLDDDLPIGAYRALSETEVASLR